MSSPDESTQDQSNKIIIGGGDGNILKAKLRALLFSSQVADVEPSVLHNLTNSTDQSFLETFSKIAIASLHHASDLEVNKPKTTH